MTSWINQMATYIRSIDGNHMARARLPAPILGVHRLQGLCRYQQISWKCIAVWAIILSTQTL